MKKDDERFKIFEKASIASIVRQMVKAAEADKPKLRYTAPWFQSWGAQILRIFGV